MVEQIQMSSDLIGVLINGIIVYQIFWCFIWLIFDSVVYLFLFSLMSFHHFH